jgi:hypothetical protein
MNISLSQNLSWGVTVMRDNCGGCMDGKRIMDNIEEGRCHV